MGDFIKGLLFGGSKPSTSPAPGAEDDFDDFASASSPSPIYSDPSSSAPTGLAFDDHSTLRTAVPYTKWYRVWERSSPSDFQAEAFIIPFIALLAAVHVWGRRKNQRKAHAWATAHGPALAREFASVGYGKSVKQQLGRGSTSERVPGAGDEQGVLLKEQTAQEYTTYASGRQNVALAEVTVKLLKRYNPMSLAMETALSFFFESFRPPREGVEITMQAFDGKEKDLVPVKRKAELDAKESRFKGLPNSAYDNFVWAVVHKEQMKRLRDERYDVSLTATKDHKSLPVWASVMSESAEVTEALLTRELVDAVQKAGEEMFEYLIITDQPIDKPLKLNEAAPRKRLILSLRLPSSTRPSAYSPTLPLFEYFLRLPDLLVSTAHFRPEVTRKIRTTREEESKKLKRAGEGEKAEERRLEAEKKKKGMRDTRLKGLSAEEQRKFLEKEREKGQKKQEKKMSRKA
ncbi:MAG: hypothetical protein Q9196_005677 [Gyalolechia fulgens]